MLAPVLLSLILLTLSCALKPSTTSLGVKPTLSENVPPSWQPTASPTTPENAPRNYPRAETTKAYPAGYLEEIMSLYNAITTEAAYTSVESIAAHATGEQASAITSLSSLIASQAKSQITFTDDAAATAYLSTLYGIYAMLPVEQQLFQSSVARRHSSIDGKWGVSTASAPGAAATTSSGGVGRLGVGVWGILGGVGFGGVVLML